MKPGERYLEYRLIKGCFIPHDSWLPWKHISMYSRKNINILRNFFREHCLKSNLQQLSHSMFCKNIARLAVARERNYGWQPSWGIKHPFISLYSKYHSPGFIYLSTMLAPVISSLDEIYCTYCLSWIFIFQFFQAVLSLFFSQISDSIIGLIIWIFSS